MPLGSRKLLRYFLLDLSNRKLFNHKSSKVIEIPNFRGCSIPDMNEMLNKDNNFWSPIKYWKFGSLQTHYEAVWRIHDMLMKFEMWRCWNKLDQILWRQTSEEKANIIAALLLRIHQSPVGFTEKKKTVQQML